MRIYNALHCRRLAVMGGVYGNVPALKAALIRAKELGCDGHVFLGDATGCYGHSDEVLNILRENFPYLIAGNHEQSAAKGLDSCGCNYTSAEDERTGCLAHSYAMKSLGERNRKWLAEWPDIALLETSLGKLLLCHGSPDQTNEFLWESQLDNKRLLSWLENYNAIGMCCTHTGLHWKREMEQGRFAVNCGVLGKPDHDGETTVHFASINLIHGEVEIINVTYDHKSWAEQLGKEGVDKIFTQPLSTGIWTCGLKSMPEAEREF